MLLKKIQSFYKRIGLYFQLFPERFQRLWQHIFRGFTFRLSKREYWKDEWEGASWFTIYLLWVFEILVLFLELLGIGELYETLSDFFKFNTRLLTAEEIALAQAVYGSTIDYDLVRIDEQAHAGPRFYRFCYVSFNLINSWGPMQQSIYIHEMMHVWQYQRFGAIYMIRALLAQHTNCGYDYGGVQALKARRKKEKVY